MAADQAPRLRLILDQRAKNPNGPTTATVWNPEDDLHGHLELSSTDDLLIDRITIYFEGVSRNWIAEQLGLNTRILKAERKFLSQAHDILQENVSRRESPSGTFVSEAPFHFIISRVIPCSNPESPEQCLQLPPSLDLGDAIIDESTGKRFAQPNITYYLRAAVGVTIRDSDDSKSLETFLPVIIAPYTEELPPTETDDFPSEFKERESKLLRRSLMGGVLGTMKISLQEPPALSYGTKSTYGRTEALIKLEFEPTSSGEVQKILQGLSYKVYSLVRVKTFYSVKSFPRLPSQTLLGHYSQTKLRDGIIKLDTETVRNVSWGYRFSTENRVNATLTSQTSLSSSIPGGSEQSNIRVLKADEPNGKWISNWTVPIEVNGRLLPTFCSSLVARFYTFVVRVKVTGTRQESFDLEVPLQVIHLSPNKTESATVEPIREGFLEYRRDSETSWFSDQSLGFEQEPPRYYA